MADPAFDDDTTSDAPAVKMPNAVPLSSPTSPAPPPSVTATSTVMPPVSLPQLKMPQMVGGSANFNPDTSAINDLVKAKAAELNAGIETLHANTGVDQSTAAAISGYQKNTLDAYGNIQKAEGLPGGSGGAIARVLSIFDSDYNVNIQKTAAEMNQLRAKSATDIAATIKERNNEIPLIYGKMSQMQQDIINAQNAQNELVLKGAQINVDRTKAHAEMISAMAQQGEYNIHQTEFAAQKLTTTEATKQLALAQQGKGAWAGKGGVLQKRIADEGLLEANLSKASAEAAKGNREEHDAAIKDAVSVMPSWYNQQLLKEAQQSGGGFVNFPTGQIDPATKKPITTQIPMGLFEQGLVQSADNDKQANTIAAANLTDRLQLQPRFQNLMNGSAAFQSMDPRVRQIQTQTGLLAKNLDATNPYNVSQTALMLKPVEDQYAQIVKDNAAKQATPEAKAAVENYGKSGSFDSVGATAFLGANMGNPAYNQTSYYAPAFNTISIGVASVLAKQHLIPAVPTNPGDLQSAFAQMLAKPNGREKINQITSEYLADPNNQKVLRSQISNKINGDSVRNTITQMAQQKNADPVWADIAAHIGQFKEQYKKDDGTMGTRPSQAKLFEALEKRSIASGGKIDYSQAFLDGLLNNARSADSTPQPGKGMEDNAVEAALYGSSPHQSIIGGLHYSMRQTAEQVHAEMKKRINRDVTGDTIKQAAQQSGFQESMAQPLINPYGLPNPIVAQTLQKKHGVDVNSVPSATGVPGLTAAQVKAMFPNGLP